jgi:hypothetical protein
MLDHTMLKVYSEPMTTNHNNDRIATICGYMFDVKMASGQTFTVQAKDAAEAIEIANASMMHTTAVSADYTKP